MPCVKPVLVSRYIQHQNNVTSAERPNLTGCPSIYMFNYRSLALLVEQWLSVSELMGSNPTRVRDFFLFLRVGSFPFFHSGGFIWNIYIQHLNLSHLNRYITLVKVIKDNQSFTYLKTSRIFVGQIFHVNKCGNVVFACEINWAPGEYCGIRSE